MNKVILWTLMIMMTTCAAAYVITDKDAAFICTMIFGAAALIVLSNKSGNQFAP